MSTINRPQNNIFFRKLFFITCCSILITFDRVFKKLVGNLVSSLAFPLALFKAYHSVFRRQHLFFSTSHILELTKYLSFCSVEPAPSRVPALPPCTAVQHSCGAISCLDLASTLDLSRLCISTFVFRRHGPLKTQKFSIRILRNCRRGCMG